MIHFFLGYCRAGFEKECAQELNSLFSIPKDEKILQYPGYVIVPLKEDPSIHDFFSKKYLFSNHIFLRQGVLGLGELSFQENVKDRVRPILGILDKNPYINDFYDVFCEFPDTNDGKEWSAFCQSFTNALRGQLKTNQKWNENSKTRLHIFFENKSHCYVGVTIKENSSKHFMGIPRLKLPKDAPSRSTLKLEEAFLTLLTAEEYEKYLVSEMNAVDLGASPGGWTYQFVKRQIHVLAVDNGNMDSNLLKSEYVSHQKADGLKFLPKNKVHWMVCDIVEKPSRIIDVVLSWIKNQKACYFIFNLKLPMKKRYEEIQLSFQKIENYLIQNHFKYTLRAKQLYFDREEITVFLDLYQFSKVR